MRPRFFPVNTHKEIGNRYWLLASEYGVVPPADMPVWLFIHLSDHAHTAREERLKAAREGLVYNR